MRLPALCPVRYNERLVRLRSSPNRWLATAAGTAAIIGLLSLVPAWIVHYRELRGEGYRTLNLDLSAWQGGSVPVLAGGIVVLLLTAAFAVAWTVGRGRRLPAALPVVAGIGAGLLGAAAWPISHVGQVSGLWLSPGWALAVGLLLAAGMVGSLLRVTEAGPRIGSLTALAVLVALAGGMGGRTALLIAAEADRPHWSDGTYSRVLDDGRRQMLTLQDETYRLDDAWSGTFEASGLTMILLEDPACPEARGAYRIFSAGDEDIRWELIVDVCADGTRIPDFTGTWQRDG